MRKLSISLLPLLLAAAGGAQAGSSFVITMDTSSISGDMGSLDFSLSPGAGSDQSLTATVSNFVGGSYGGSLAQDGNASGGPVASGFPLTLVANNASQLNDEFDTFDYGNSLSFLVTLSGPALSPDGSATSPYEFDFFTYSDAAGSVPVLTSDPNGISAAIDIGPSAIGVSATAVSSEVGITPSPEPGSIWLFAGAMGLSGLYFMLRRLRTNSR